MAEEIKIVVGAVDKFSPTFKKLSASFMNIKVLSAAAVGAITTLGGAVFALTKQTANSYDQIGKFASRIGISTEALSKYRYVAERSGVKIMAMNIALQRMTRRIGEASTGIGIVNPAFAKLGLNIESLISKNPDQQFMEIARALDGVQQSFYKKLGVIERNIEKVNWDEIVNDFWETLKGSEFLDVEENIGKKSIGVINRTFREFWTHANRLVKRGKQGKIPRSCAG